MKQFDEIKPKLSVDSFYFSSYPFRKPETKRMIQHRNSELLLNFKCNFFQF